MPPESESLRKMLRECGLSMAEMSRRSGVDGGKISRFLSGKQDITLVSAMKLMGQLKVTWIQRGKK